MRGRTNSSFTMSMQPIMRLDANLSDHEVPTPFSGCSSSRKAVAPRRNGGARRSRTDDILLAKQALYQLSYGPIKGTSRVSRRRCHGPARRLVGPGRLELPTLRLSGVRSNHLSYGPMAATALSSRTGSGTGSRSRHRYSDPDGRSVDDESGKRNGDGGFSHNASQFYLWKLNRRLNHIS